MHEDSKIELTTGGAGFVTDATSRSKSNRNALPSNRKTSKTSGSNVHSKKIRDKEISAEELAKVKQDIREQFKSRKKKEILIIAAITIIVVLGLLMTTI